MFLVEVTTLSEEGVTVGPEGPVYIQVRKGGTVGPKGSFTNGKERGHSASVPRLFSTYGKRGAQLVLISVSTITYFSQIVLIIESI